MVNSRRRAPALAVLVPGIGLGGAVAIMVAEQLNFEVQDDGKGFDPAAQKMGSGTQNMEDRLDALGGVVNLASQPGAGTRVLGSVPTAASVVP